MEFQEICLAISDKILAVLFLPQVYLFNSQLRDPIAVFFAPAVCLFIIQILLCAVFNRSWIKNIPLYYCFAWWIYNATLFLGKGTLQIPEVIDALELSFPIAVLLGWTVYDLIHRRIMKRKESDLAAWGCTDVKTEAKTAEDIKNEEMVKLFCIVMIAAVALLMVL